MKTRNLLFAIVITAALAVAALSAAPAASPVGGPTAAQAKYVPCKARTAPSRSCRGWRYFNNGDVHEAYNGRCSVKVGRKRYRGVKAYRNGRYSRCVTA